MECHQEINADVIILANKVRVSSYKKFIAKKFFWAIGCNFTGGIFPIEAEKKKFSRPVIKCIVKFIEKKCEPKSFFSPFFGPFVEPLFNVIGIEIVKKYENHIEACIRTIKEALEE